MEKRWKIINAEDEKVNALHQSLQVHPLLCKILVQRNIETYEQAKDFFRPQLTSLHSPWLMKDMDLAVDRIQLALHKKEKILVFGDYDVDGTTSVACMFQFLNKIHTELDFYIPHRYKEGYGVSKAGIDFAKKMALPHHLVGLWY
jgi:single-stranded-DNA-specific exonuclease